MLAAFRGKALTIGVASVLTIILIYLATQESEYSPTKLASNFGYVGSTGEKDTHGPTSTHAPIPANSSEWEFIWERDERNLGLSEEQCQVWPASLERAMTGFSRFHLGCLSPSVYRDRESTRLARIAGRYHRRTDQVMDQ